MPLIHNQGRKIGDKFIARKVTFPKSWGKGDDGILRPVVNDAGKPIEEELLPGAHKQVTQEQYEHLKGVIGNEIVNIDDLKDMQSRFAETAPQQRKHGYLSPEEVENERKKAVAEYVAKSSVDGEKQTKFGEYDPAVHAAEEIKQSENAAKKAVGQDDAAERAQLVAKIDAMDRSELIALIEKEKLNVAHKSMPIDKLKSAILEALEEKR